LCHAKDLPFASGEQSISLFAKNFVSVFGDIVIFRVAAPLGRGFLQDIHDVCFIERGDEEIDDIFIKGFEGTPAENTFGRLIPFQYTVILIDHDEGDGRVAKKLVIAVLALFKRRLRTILWTTHSVIMTRSAGMAKSSIIARFGSANEARTRQ
jgi:hypothetical protein